MILSIERAVAARLAQALHPLPVEALPSRGYRFTHAKGAAVVLAAQLQGSAVNDAAASIQDATLTLEVALYARSLRDGAGVWDLFEAQRRALHSMVAAPGATPLRLLDARLSDAEADTWTLLTRWACRVPLIPDLSYDGGPLLTLVTFNQE